MTRTIYIYPLLILILYGCGTMKNISNEEISQAKYFTSPSEAVPVITDLLKKQDFKTLTAFYDLSFSKIKRADLESGDFFIRKEHPEADHPAGFWRYKHPFAPGYTFSSIQSTAQEGVYSVQVQIEIDQGADSPQQTGFSDFYMIKSDKGWQILPDRY